MADVQPKIPAYSKLAVSEIMRLLLSVLVGLSHDVYHVLINVWFVLPILSLGLLEYFDLSNRNEYCRRRTANSTPTICNCQGKW
jgi:hypothetical protein